MVFVHIVINRDMDMVVKNKKTGYTTPTVAKNINMHVMIAERK
jgi:hypothetical protein